MKPLEEIHAKFSRRSLTVEEYDNAMADFSITLAKIRIKLADARVYADIESRGRIAEIIELVRAQR